MRDGQPRSLPASQGALFRRRRPESNRRIRVLQTPALPLGYVALLLEILPRIALLGKLSAVFEAFASCSVTRVASSGETDHGASVATRAFLEALTLPFHVIRNELLDDFSNGE
jgi:hypothetical protein